MMFIKTIVLNIIYYIKKLLSYEDNHIHQCVLKYSIDGDKYSNKLNKFWKNESRYWSGPDEFYSVITDVTAEDIDDAPDNVDYYTVTVKYTYSGKIYKYISNNACPKWPIPNDTSGPPTISMPIKSAYVLDDDDKPVIDITRKIKRYAGPKSNFYNQEIRVRDIMDYDPEMFPKIKITNILEQHAVIDMEDGVLNIRQMFSSPSKS